MHDFINISRIFNFCRSPFQRKKITTTSLYHFLSKINPSLFTQNPTKNPHKHLRQPLPTPPLTLQPSLTNNIIKGHRVCYGVGVCKCFILRMGEMLIKGVGVYTFLEVCLYRYPSTRLRRYILVNGGWFEWWDQKGEKVKNAINKRYGTAFWRLGRLLGGFMVGVGVDWSVLGVTSIICGREQEVRWYIIKDRVWLGFLWLRLTF